MKKYKLVILAILVFMICFIYQFFFSTLNMDEIWNYGFGYNIFKGLIPYRDFNMIVTPLFSFLLVPLIYLFGNHIYLLSIINSIIATIIFLVGYKMIRNKMFVLFPILLLRLETSYNLLCLMILLLILFSDDIKIEKKDILLGILASALLLTKQTVGACLLIPLFLYSKNKKLFTIGFFPLCCVFIIFLLYTNSLSDFFNYCFFGMFSFTKKNGLTNFNIYILIIYFILLISMIYLMIKNRFKDRKLVYIFAFQIIAFPILDAVHTSIALIPYLIYIFKNIKLNWTFYLVIGMIACASLITNTTVLGLDNYTIYYRNNSFLNGRGMYIDTEFLENLYPYIDKQYPDHTIYNLSELSYLLKLESNKDINKFDIINDGNMGYNGEKKYIQEIEKECNKQKCVFIIDDEIEGQTSKIIINYIKNSYTLDKHIDRFLIYTNTVN